jgi:glycosyltransferase involved in cell wall biosynthesis
MRVGIDVHVLTGAAQGTVTVWRAMLAQLPADDATYVLYSFDPAVTAAGFPGPHFVHRRIPIKQAHLRFQVTYPWMAGRDRCDAFHTNYYLPLLGLPGSVVTIHDIIYLDFPDFAPAPIRRAQFAMLTRWAARHARAILVPSAYTKARLMERFGIPSARVTVVPNALSSEWHTPDEAAIAAAWERLRHQCPERFLLGVGRLDPRKNVLATARIAHALQGEALTDGLVWVGGDDFGGSAIRHSLAAEGLPVVRLEGLTTVELQAVYRHAQALLFLSLAEGFGYPPLEAMAMGTPAVASNRTAIPDTVGHAGILVNPDDYRQVLDATRHAITDLAVRRTLSAMGLAHAATFQPAGIAARTAAVYRSAAEHQPARDERVVGLLKPVRRHLA